MYAKSVLRDVLSKNDVMSTGWLTSVTGLNKDSYRFIHKINQPDDLAKHYHGSAFLFSSHDCVN